MSGGGSKPGERRGGRPRGAPNKRTLAFEKARLETAAKITEALGPKAFEGDAHAFLVAVYKDPSHPYELRIDAAKAAVRYEKPALATSSVTIQNPLAAMNDQDLLQILALAQSSHVLAAQDDANVH